MKTKPSTPARFAPVILLGFFCAVIRVFGNLAKYLPPYVVDALAKLRLKMPPLLGLMLKDPDPVLIGSLLRLKSSNLLLEAKILRLQCSYIPLHIHVALLELRAKYWVWMDRLLHNPNISIRTNSTACRQATQALVT
jgi:hypothetical protein